MNRIVNAYITVFVAALFIGLLGAFLAFLVAMAAWGFIESIAIRILGG